MTVKKDSSKPKYQPDIPIIADAVVVVDESNEENDVENNNLPPATNPNFVPSTSNTTTNNNGASVGNFTPMPSSMTTSLTTTGGNHPTTTTTTTTAIVTTGGSNFGGGNSKASSSAILYQLGRNSTGLQCCHCNRQTVTVVKDYIGVGTVIAILLLAIFFWPLCWLPLCIPSCKRTNHYCGHPECGEKVGQTRVCA